MKLIDKQIVDGKIVLTTSTKILLWHKIRKFEAQREYPTGYWNWLELPDRNIVIDSISFQLDMWNRMQ